VRGSKAEAAKLICSCFSMLHGVARAFPLGAPIAAIRRSVDIGLIYWEIVMRIAAIIILVLLTGPAFVGVATAQTQQKASKNSGACSLAACEAACSKNGGRQCNLYCSNEMARKGCH
jgi:hypothetical protein